MANSECLLLF